MVVAEAATQCLVMVEMGQKMELRLVVEVVTVKVEAAEADIVAKLTVLLVEADELEYITKIKLKRHLSYGVFFS
jgi:hypothetical protein